MNRNKTHLFIAISSAALLALLIIQVSWIFKTAKIKEELFNEKAKMVLARTVEALSSDKETCRNMETAIGKNEIQKIDSLFKHYMKFYNFHIDYSFDVIRPIPFKPINETYFAANVYNKRLDEVVSKNGLELKLILPEKRQFIIAEMGTLFITSVVLIIVVLILFWRTIISLMKEKKISEQTTDFLNNMTHEFKTPLTNIALASKMIVKDLTPNQENKTKQYTEIILEENEKLKLQVEQVLSLTALERGEIPLQKVTLDFHELIKNSLKCMSMQLVEKQGNVDLSLRAERVAILGDKIHLTNAICNLLDNAIKYAALKPDVTIKTFNSENNLIVTIADNGIGIERKFQKKIFHKYFRIPTGNIHDVKGFGLGLAYVKKIIELHSGTIVLKSEKGNGAIFSITLPNV